MTDKNNPLDILKERYVNGEITREQFDQMKVNLESAYKSKKKTSNKKKIALCIGISFALLFVVGAISSAVSNTSSSSSSKSILLGEKENPGQISQTITIGDIDYKVTSVSATSMIGDNIINIKPQGVFILVNFDVENNGKQSETILDNYFKLIDSQGREFATDDKAWIYLQNNVMFKQLQPNLPTKGEIVFDVPISSESYTLRIVDGLNSPDTDKYIQLGSYPQTIGETPSSSLSPNSTSSANHF